MFYRWRPPNDILMMTDLSNTYMGKALFILGGSPELNRLPIYLLDEHRLPTMALNNVPYVFPRPTFWLTADKPPCYGSQFYHRTDIIKFARMDHHQCIVPGPPHETLMHYPMVLFYDVKPGKYTEENFLDDGSDVVWWRSVFPISLQLAWRLGFRKVYLVGCGFWTSSDKPYAWDAKLTPPQRDYSQQTYNEDVDKLRSLMPLFKSKGFSVISCTPNSKATFLPNMDLESAIKAETALAPKPTPFDDLKHSSSMS